MPFLSSSHTIMFHATLILGVSVVFIVQHPSNNAKQPPPAENPTQDEINATHFMYKAKWCMAISFSITIFCLSSIATLSRSLDKPGSLKVTNRYLRILPRMGLIAVAMCLPIEKSQTGTSFLGTLVAILGSVLVWEWYASLESSGGVFEP